MATYRAAGSTDEITTCDVCGRAELKGTVRLVIDDDEGEIFAGVSCAARLAGTTSRVITSQVKAADKARKHEEYVQSLAEDRAKFALMIAWLKERGLVHNFANSKLYYASLKGA